MAPAERSAHLFDIVNQLNIGAACLTTPEEAKALADLNLQAGRKAKAGAAFLAALEYFEAGLACMDDNDWETAYELTIALHTEAAEAACLCGRYERMEALVLLVQQRARSILDKVPVCGTEIRALTARGRLVPAIRSGLRALERLGMHLPEEPSAAEVNEAMARAFALLQQQTIEGLIDLPPMTAPEQLASLSLLSEIGEPAYAASPQFFLVWASSMAELSLRHGNCPLSPFAYAAYALALCATGEIETGSLLSKAAIAMIDALKAHSLRCRLLNIHGCTIQPWTEPLRDTLPTLTEAVGAGAESGDFTSGSYAAFNACTAAFFMGEPLEELGVRVSTNLKIIAGLRQTYIWNWVAFHVPVIRRLHGEENVPARPDDFDEASWLIAARDAKDRCGLAYYFLGRLIAAYLLNDKDLAEARAHIAEIKENMAGFQGAFAVPVFSFYCALTLLKRHGAPQAENDAASLEEVRAHLAKLDSLARYAPMNFRHKCDLIAAELARLQGEDWRAAGLYEKAIAGARENGFFQEEALANELAAKFYFAHGREEYARLHLSEAQRGYGRWQAFTKVRALEAEYPQWLKRVDSRQPAAETHSLDMESVLKATHAISGEIEMGRVLDKVMRIVIENAGAQIGFLLMKSDGAWTVAARGEIGRSDVEIPIPEGVDESDAVSAGVIHFVARTRKTVVLADAATRGAFIDDPHIRREKTRSLLATPLINRGRLLGILYLVNNLATHTFTPERIQLLEVLSAQAAITLETAGAYEALRASEEKYRTLIQKLRAAVVVHAADTRIVTCNPVAQTLLGLTEDQLLGKTGLDPAWHFYREDGTEMPQAEYPINQVLATRQPLVNLVVGVHRPGNEQDVWAMVNADPVFGPENEISEIIVTFIDITERKAAEEALQRSNEMLRAIIEAAPVAIFGLDLDGHVYSVWNPAAEKMLGWRAQEVMGRPLPAAPVAHKEEFGRFRKQIRGGMILDGVEVRRQRCDGIPIDYSIYTSPLHDAQGRVTGNMAVLVDITERKKADRERLANLKFFESMDRVNRSIQGTDDLEEVMKDVLDVVLSIFDCDRAYLMYPCDPESPTWSVPMEVHKPEYPWALDLKLEMPMDPQVAETLRIQLAAEGPMAFGPGTPHALPEDVAQQFGFKCLMSMAIYPRTGNPWQFGIHQCTHARIWTAEEVRVFEAIGRRLADSLSSLLSYRDLRKNEEFLDNVVEHIPNMIFVKDAQTLRFVRFNKVGEQLVGYPREELIGKTDYDFFPKEVAEFFTAKDRQVLESKSLVDIPEEIIRNRSGEERILHTKKIPILDETGAPQYLLGISEDITERKQAEESIRKLSQAIEQSPVSIVITDVEGSIEFVNAKFTQITGYSYAEALGQNPRILKSGETPAEEYRRLWKTIGSGSVWRGEFHNRKKTGELFWEKVTIAPVRDVDHVISHYVAVKEDITERKKLEEQLHQTQKMEAVGQLAGGVAHDFNNMLGVIIGHAELALEKADLDASLCKNLEGVLNAAFRSSEITRQLLAFARKQTIAPKILDLNETVEGMLKLLRRLIGEDMDLAWLPGAKQWPVKMDPSQIDQILANLCVNARDAIDGVGKITIETHKADFDDAYCTEHKGFQPGEYVVLAVSDNGSGMDKPTMDKIFEPFFTTKGVGQGTGLGLATVYGIVKQNKGFINVYSEPGHGSTFKVYLPRHLDAAGQEPKAGPEPQDLSGHETILVVEDEILNLELVALMLERYGYQVLTAASPGEALFTAKGHTGKIHLLLTDLIMPEMNGRDLAKEMTSLYPDMMCLIMSGYTKNVIAHRNVLDEDVHFIQKPFSMQNLAAKVREVLDSGRA